MSKTKKAPEVRVVRAGAELLSSAWAGGRGEGKPRTPVVAIETHHGRELAHVAQACKAADISGLRHHGSAGTVCERSWFAPGTACR